MAETIEGSIRAWIIENLPQLPVYRKTAPEGTTTPTVVINGGISFGSVNLGEDILVNEEVQIDLYQDYATISSLPDTLHKLLHKAPIIFDGADFYRLSVISRTTDIAEEGNDDGIERITFTVEVKRILK